MNKIDHNRRNFWQASPVLTLMLLLCFWAFLSSVVCADMIEYTDDDPVQWLNFNSDSGYCDPTVIDSVQIWVQIDPDSGFFTYGSALTDSMLNDSLSSVGFRYIPADRDSLGRIIPGHYTGEYWYFTVTFYNTGPVLSPDTVHQVADYYRLGGCLPVHEVDR